MFVQSAEFIKAHKSNPSVEISVATLKEIEAQGWSLNPGRYVGMADKAADDFIFSEMLEELNDELEVLNSEARELEDRIAANVAKLLEAAT
jgi:type I restriction enzyme M protein